jgi:hypothetical protein
MRALTIAVPSEEGITFCRVITVETAQLLLHLLIRNEDYNKKSVEMNY